MRYHVDLGALADMLHDAVGDKTAEGLELLLQLPPEARAEAVGKAIEQEATERNPRETRVSGRPLRRCLRCGRMLVTKTCPHCRAFPTNAGDGDQKE